MSQNIFSEKDAYRFMKVEKFFEKYKEWNVLGDVLGYQFDSQEFVLKLKFNINGKEDFYARIEFIDDGTFRFRFNVNKKDFNYNTAQIIQDTLSQLRQCVYKHEKNIRNIDAIRVITCEKKKDGNAEYLQMQCRKFIYTTMIVLVYFKPFRIQVKYVGLHSDCKQNNLKAPTIWKTAVPGIYYTPNGKNQYAMIQAIEKPANSKYIGFGEQGGISLTKNTSQLNYFNYDNMRYMQVYNKGPLDNRQPLYHSQPFFFEYNAIPGSKFANAIFIANGGQVLVDLGYSHSSRYMLGTRTGDLDYIYFFGSDTQTLVYNYTSIVGRSTLKPRYVLGYHQGCYGYQKRSDIQWCVDMHRQYKIPLDGIHIDVDIQHKYQTFTIDTQKFPNPKQMFTNLRLKGIKCSTNITPVISRQDQNYKIYKQAKQNNYFILDRRYDYQNIQSRQYQNYQGGYQKISNNPKNIQGYNSGFPYIGGVYYGKNGDIQLGTTGHYLDLSKKKIRDWWGKQYKYLMECGLEFIWQDMTTPAIRDIYGDMKSFPSRLKVTSSYYCKKNADHPDQTYRLTPFIKEWNLYSYNLHKATYKGLNDLQSRKNKRNFIIGRGSFTGSHRFSGLWTGDNSSDWNFLKINVSQALSLGMCGVVINGQDIGGFQQNQSDERWANPELLIRWTVAGAFLPWFRNHYIRKGRKDFQEVFMYEHFFKERNLPLPQPQDLYRMVLPICRHYIELRYRLLQLFYDLMFENTLTGLPICRPLFFEAPDDLTLFNDKQNFLNNQFFVGKYMLVAPILWPRFKRGYDSKGERNIYLPTGFNWYHFKNNSQPLSPLVEGGLTVRDFDASLNPHPDHINFIVPIYIKQGAIIPTIQLEQYVGELHDKGLPNPITFNIYPGNYLTNADIQGNLIEHLRQNTQYKCYIDDGVSRSSASTMAHPEQKDGDDQAKDEYRKINVSHVTINSERNKILQRNVFLLRQIDNYTPLEKYYFVALLHSPEQDVPVAGVRINKEKIPQKNLGSNSSNAKALSQSNQSSWYYNDYLRITYVKVFDTSKELLISAIYR